ncbi:MAG: ATP-binding protein, partial [Neisseriaceae bacterium]|nr:ATP-binding protein [Neisseriaceae bacterium]
MKQTHSFQTEIKQLLHLMIHSLYSDKEIFLRELVSNAIDATQKLKALSSRSDFKGELGDLTIDVAIDGKNKTLTVKDRGIGMSADEVEKYINQI